VGDKIRLSPDERLFVESTDSSSRDLYEAVASVVAGSFVNVFPTAVRTFRELVEPPVDRSQGLMDVVTGTFNSTGLVNVTSTSDTITFDEGSYNLPAHRYASDFEENSAELQGMADDAGLRPTKKKKGKKHERVAK
jgi:hypothetical protein